MQEIFSSNSDLTDTAKSGNTIVLLRDSKKILNDEGFTDIANDKNLGGK